MHNLIIKKPGLFKQEAQRDKMICLCNKMYCCTDITEVPKKDKVSAKGIQKHGNNVNQLWGRVRTKRHLPVACSQVPGK